MFRLNNTVYSGATTIIYSENFPTEICEHNIDFGMDYNTDNQTELLSCTVNHGICRRLQC